MSDKEKFCVFIAVFIVVALSAIYLANISSQDFLKFIAESIVDNAIFCAMFIVIVMVTGISC